ncbi:toll/interleukin-1 receptor domain-containing protein, partial [Candidatus Latescibacterota bacterium]
TEQLHDRWKTKNGKILLKNIIKISKQGQDWSYLLKSLPHVEEIENGRDLRCADFSNSELKGIDLSCTDLSYSYFKSCILDNVNFCGSNCLNVKFINTTILGCIFKDVNFQVAYFTDSIIASCDLSGANFNQTIFLRAFFRSAKLNKAVFKGPILSHTTFSDLDLRNVKGLDTIIHFGASTIGIDTLEKSAGNIPEVFMRGCGLSNELIKFASSLSTGQNEYFSCFISYAEEDREVAEKVAEILRFNNIRCWFFPKDAITGKGVWEEIDEAIKEYDKLIPILSNVSLKKPAVIREIKRGLHEERKRNERVLFPIRIDAAIFSWGHELAVDLQDIVIADFTSWRLMTSYSRELHKFLTDLKSVKII